MLTAPRTRVDVDHTASRCSAHLRKARDEAAAQGGAAFEVFMDRRRSQLAGHEDVLQGKAEPLQPFAYHEANRNALRAFLSCDLVPSCWICPLYVRTRPHLGSICVFRTKVAGRLGIVTGNFGNLTGYFGNVTDRIGRLDWRCA